MRAAPVSLRHHPAHHVLTGTTVTSIITTTGESLSYRAPGTSWAASSHLLVKTLTISFLVAARR